MRVVSVLLAACALSAAPAAAKSQKQAGAAAVLIPGAGGIHPNDFLVRNQHVFGARGIAAQMTTSASEAAAMVQSLKAQGLRVTLVGMSAGSKTVAEAIAAGARPDRVVFAAAFLDAAQPGSVPGTLGSPALLPPTLVVHNRNDQCQFTPPEAVAGFVRWSGGRARVAWVTSSVSQSPPCRALSPHAFHGADAAAIGPIVSFAR